MVMAETHDDKEAIKQQVRTLPLQRKQALYAILNRYVEGDDLSHLRCSTSLAEIITELGALDIISAYTVSQEQDTATLEIRINASDELVGDLWQLLHDLLEDRR
jgi:hypothetical protein